MVPSKKLGADRPLSMRQKTPPDNAWVDSEAGCDKGAGLGLTGGGGSTEGDDEMRSNFPDAGGLSEKCSTPLLSRQR